MAFPKDTLLENFSDGKKPTQAQWHQLIDQIRPYNNSSDRQTIITNIKDVFSTGSMVNDAMMTNIITQCKIARPFATDYDTLKTKFATGSKPTGDDFATLINALNYTQLPCVVKYVATAIFRTANAADYSGHVLGIVIEASISPATMSGTKLIIHATNGGNWSMLDTTSMGNKMPLIGAWLSDVTFSNVTIRVLLASTAQSQKIVDASISVYIAKTEDAANRIPIIQNVVTTQKDQNGLVVAVPNVKFTVPNYDTVLGQNAYLFCTARLTTF